MSPAASTPGRSKSIRASRAIEPPEGLTRAPQSGQIPAHSSTNTMGKQYNKVIKKKRRVAYLKRKNAANKAKAKKK